MLFLVSGAYRSITAFAIEPPTDPLSALTSVATSKAEVNLGNTAVLLAHALDPEHQIAVYTKRLDALASELRDATATEAGAKDKLAVMANVVYKRWGFADRKTLPANRFVSFADVLDRRQWNCFGMSVLYVALGERIGLPLQMVSGRGHALVYSADANAYIETTESGRIYENTDYLRSLLPFPCLDPKAYRPIPAREAVAVLLTQTGAAFAAQDNLGTALSCFKHALEFDARHAEAHAALGFLYTKAGPLDRALASFRAAIAADPTLREAYGGLGAALRAKGDLEGAAEAYRKAVALCATQPEPVFNLGQVLYESGEFDASIDAFRKYTALVPDDPDGFVRLAFPLEDTGKLEEALAAYDSALRLKPRNADALVNSGAIREKQGKIDTARGLYEKALQVSPDNALAYAGLGRVYSTTGRHVEAAKAFSRSLELDSQNPATWIDFAKLEKKQKNLPAAIAKLKRALEMSPAESETHVELALTYLQLGDIENARTYAKNAESLGASLPGELRSLLDRQTTK